MSDVNIWVPASEDVAAVFRFTFWDGPRALVQGACRHPKVWALGLAVIGLGVLFGRAAAYVVYLPVLGVPWWILHRESFRRWVAGPLRSDWRRWWRYQRRWPNVMSENGLSVPRENGLDEHPQIVKARTVDRSVEWQTRKVEVAGHQLVTGLKRIVTCTDVLWVRSLLGQDTEDYQAQAQTIGKDYGARVGRAFEEDEGGRRLKGCVRFEITYGPDPLAKIIPALPIPESVDDIDFSAVPVGRTEKGELWTLDLRLHGLVAGSVGSGKSSALQQLIRSLGPAIREGLVVIHAVDPKFGMELGPVSAMFRYYEDDEPADMATLLENSAEMMKQQSRALKLDGLRKNRPTRERPLHLVIIDEMIDLTDPKGPDKQVTARVKVALGLLLRKGRASGFIVIGTVTDPRIEALPMRGGFPVRVGMRLSTAQETKAILGDGARLRGARCEDIGIHESGVAYVLGKGEKDAVRVRAAYVTNEDIAEMVRDYAPTVNGEPEPDMPSPPFDAEATADEDGPVLELVQGGLADDDEGWE